MPSTDRRLELKEKTLMAQNAWQVFVYANGLTTHTSPPMMCKCIWFYTVMGNLSLHHSFHSMVSYHTQLQNQTNIYTKLDGVPVPSEILTGLLGLWSRLQSYTCTQSRWKESTQPSLLSSPTERQAAGVAQHMEELHSNWNHPCWYNSVQ